MANARLKKKHRKLMKMNRARSPVWPGPAICPESFSQDFGVHFAPVLASSEGPDPSVLARGDVTTPAIRKMVKIGALITCATEITCTVQAVEASFA